MNQSPEYFVHTYRGYNPERGTINVSVYAAEGLPLLIHAVQPRDNQATSITNMAEYIAAEVMDYRFPEYLMPNGLKPWVWVESYEDKEGKSEAFDACIFDSIEPTRTRTYTDSAQPVRLKLGTPHWKRIPAEQFHRLCKGDRKAFDGVPTNNSSADRLQREGERT